MKLTCKCCKRSRRSVVCVCAYCKQPFETTFKTVYCSRMCFHKAQKEKSN